jgi:hypothetical protein
MTQQTQEQDIADRFISGLGNISKARFELKMGITALVSIYAGAIELRLSRLEAANAVPMIDSPDAPWRIRREHHARAWSLYWGGEELYASNSDYAEPPRSKVMQIRKDLAKLIECLMTTFPDTCVQISYIFDAAGSTQ